MGTLTRYDSWMQRVLEGNLDFWGEHWRDLSTTAQYAAWRQLAEARGVDTDLQYRMTRSLLREVIYAAGGVERELVQLRATMADVQQFADEALVQHPRSAEEWPTCGLGIATPSMRVASYIFTNLLSWARSTLDRTERLDRHGHVRESAGLLPALAPGRFTTAWRRHSGISRALFPTTGCLRITRSMQAPLLEAARPLRNSSPQGESWPVYPTRSRRES